MGTGVGSQLVLQYATNIMKRNREEIARNSISDPQSAEIHRHRTLSFQVQNLNILTVLPQNFINTKLTLEKHCTNTR